MGSVGETENYGRITRGEAEPTPESSLAGRIWRRGEPGYEAARRATMWKRRSSG